MDQPHEQVSGELRRRLDDVFGDVLPDVTRDERDEDSAAADNDDALLRDRPPHHDRD